MTILLGADLAPSERHVAEAAARFAQRRGEELVVAHVSARPEAHHDEVAALLADLRPLVAQLRAAPLRGDTVGDTVGAALSRLAAHERATLLFVGASDGFMQSPLGSVAAIAVRTGEVPVFVVRQAVRATSDRLRLLAVLALDETDAGVVDAIAALGPAAAHIDVTAVHYRAELAGGDEERRAARLAERDVRATLAALPDRCALERVVVRDPRGDLAKDVAALAHEHAVDVVVCGSHHRHGAARVLEGSVAERIVHAAPVSVLVGRAPRRS